MATKRQVAKRRVSEAFGKWLSQWASLDRKKRLKLLSRQMRRRVYFKRYIRVWKAKFDHQVKKRTLQQLKAEFTRDTIKRRMFMTWLTKMRQQCHLARQDQAIVTEKKTDTLGKVLHVLKHYAEKKRRQRALSCAIDETRRLAILRKCVVGWQGFVPETQSKQLLLEQVGKDYSLKVMQSVFDVLKTNRDYRIEKECTDALMKKSVHMIVAKRFFRSWRSLANKRIGLALLADTMKKLQVASLFKRLARMSEFDSQARGHVGLLREFLLLQKAFKVMDRYAHRKDYLAAKGRECKKMKAYLSAKQHFRLWRERLETSNKYEKMACFAIIQVKNELQAKYFHVLKARYMNAANIRKVGALRNVISKRVAFKALAKVSLRTRLYKQLSKQRHLEEK